MRAWGGIFSFPMHFAVLFTCGDKGSHWSINHCSWRRDTLCYPEDEKWMAGRLEGTFLTRGGADRSSHHSKAHSDDVICSVTYNLQSVPPLTCHLQSQNPQPVQPTGDIYSIASCGTSWQLDTEDTGYSRPHRHMVWVQLGCSISFSKSI